MFSAKPLCSPSNYCSSCLLDFDSPDVLQPAHSRSQYCLRNPRNAAAACSVVEGSEGNGRSHHQRSQYTQVELGERGFLEIMESHRRPNRNVLLHRIESRPSKSTQCASLNFYLTFFVFQFVISVRANHKGVQHLSHERRANFDGGRYKQKRRVSGSRHSRGH